MKWFKRIWAMCIAILWLAGMACLPVQAKMVEEEVLDSDHLLREQTAMAIYECYLEKPGTSNRISGYEGFYLSDDGNLVVCVADAKAETLLRKLLTQDCIAQKLEEVCAELSENVDLSGVDLEIIQQSVVQYQTQTYTTDEIDDVMELLLNTKEYSIGSIRNDYQSNRVVIVTIGNVYWQEILDFVAENGYAPEMIAFEPEETRSYGREIYEEYLRDLLPSYNADVYFDGDVLVICIADEKLIDTLREKLPADAEESGAVRFALMEYSYWDLYVVHMYLGSQMLEYDISYTALDTVENTVRVGTWDDSRRLEILEAVNQKGYNPDTITFVSEEKPAPATYTPYQMQPEDYKVSFSASPRTYIILIGTILLLIVEYSLFGYFNRLNRREAM